MNKLELDNMGLSVVAYHALSKLAVSYELLLCMSYNDIHSVMINEVKPLSVFNGRKADQAIALANEVWLKLHNES